MRECKIRFTVSDSSPYHDTPDEKARLKTLRALQILHTDPELVFDNLAQLAAAITSAPFAAINLIARDEQWCKAQYGWMLDSIPRDKSPCALVVEKRAPIIAEDVKLDERLSARFPICPETEIRFYAGFPIFIKDQAVGTLCVASTELQKLTKEQANSLVLLSSQVSHQMAIRQRVAELDAENSDLLIQELGAEMAEEKYRSIFEHVQEGIFQTTQDGQFISANPMLAQIYGFDTSDDLIAGMKDISVQLYVDPKRRNEFMEIIQETDIIHNFESQARRMDGELIWISENVRAVKNSSNDLLYYEGTVMDITEKKNAEKALHESDLLYHSLVETIPQNILRKNCDGMFTFANQRFCETIGKPLEAILGKTDHDLFPKDLADKYRRDDKRVLETDQPLVITETHHQPDGTDLHVEVIKSPLRDNSGNVIGLQCMFWDVTEKHVMEEQLAYEHDLLSALLENVPDRIYVKDTESRFIKGSAALAKRLGLKSVDEFVGKTDYDFHPDDQARQFHEDEQRVILTGEAIVNKVEQQTDANNRSIWASVTKVPFTNRSGMITGIIGISRDITALKLAEEESARARDLAVEAALMKAQFLAVMSHEIRTPMNGIIGMIDLLLATELTVEQHEYADTVRTSADALLEILNDILDLSKIEAGRLELEKEEFSLRKIVEEAVELHALRADASNIELNCHIPFNLDGQFRGDAGRLRQILLNLVSNAVKFTEQGEVQVSVLCPEKTEGSLEIEFTVRDTGIGISPKVQEKIFDAFRQADGTTTRRYGGTGLGLSISRQLTEMMGGEMWLESETGVGSAFHFTVILEKSGGRSNEPSPELEGRKLLLVIPNDFARNSICEYISQWNLKVISCATGGDARKQFKQNAEFDFILVDISLRDEDCLDLVQEIQTNKKSRSAKIILLTTRRHKADPDMLSTLGIAGTLLKPVRLDRLHQSLLIALSGKPHAPKIKTVSNPALHRSLRVLVAEDNPINQRVAILQLGKLGHEVEIRDDGQGVLDADLNKFDVILMDCQMPVVDGLKATRQIRQRELADPSVEPVYIIAMTANTQEADRAACLEAGMDDFISKPVQLAELVESMNKSLGIDNVDAPGNSDSLLLDETHLSQLRGNGQDDALREIIGLFLEQTHDQISQLNEAISKNNAQTTSSLAHQLKGSSANLGARRLSDTFSELEQSAKNNDLSQAGELLEVIRVTFDRTRIQFQSLLQD